MSLFETLTGESWRRAIHMGRTDPNLVRAAIDAARAKFLAPMNTILILQSSSSTAPRWVRECMNTVQLWADRNGYDYVHVGDELFSYTPEYGAPFTKIQISDLARIRLMKAHLFNHRYAAVYWLDADFLIWNIHEFNLPLPVPGSVVLPMEAFKIHRDYIIQLNNSVLGFCDYEDAAVLETMTKAALDKWKDGVTTPPHIVAGPAVVSKFRFPLRRIIAKQAGCFSETTTRQILGPWHAGREYLRQLSMAHGATLKGANLCSSRNISEDVMEDLIADLIQGYDHEIGQWAHFSAIYRIWLRARIFPFRVKCWLQTRVERIRKTLMPAS